MYLSFWCCGWFFVIGLDFGLVNFLFGVVLFGWVVVGVIFVFLFYFISVCSGYKLLFICVIFWKEENLKCYVFEVVGLGLFFLWEGDCYLLCDSYEEKSGYFCCDNLGKGGWFVKWFYVELEIEIVF